MGDKEQQDEEREALLSIYEGDKLFKEVSATTYQYRYGEEENKSFILEVSWGTTYPTDKPTINLDIFFNRNLNSQMKSKILEIVDSEANQWVGCAMTYTLFECLKDRVDEIMEMQSLVEPTAVEESVQKITLDDDQETSVKKVEKKEQLTKSQKRRAWDRAEIGKSGEKPRGYDWVDLIKHLSQVPHIQNTNVQ